MMDSLKTWGAALVCALCLLSLFALAASRQITNEQQIEGIRKTTITARQQSCWLGQSGRRIQRERIVRQMSDINSGRYDAFLAQVGYTREEALERALEDWESQWPVDCTYYADTGKIRTIKQKPPYLPSKSAPAPQ